MLSYKLASLSRGMLFLRKIKIFRALGVAFGENSYIITYIYCSFERTKLFFLFKKYAAIFLNYILRLN